MEGLDFSLGGMIKSLTWYGWAIAICLTIMSFWSISVFIDRILAFRSSKRHSARALNEAYARLDEGSVEDAIEATRKHPSASLARIMGAALASSVEDKRRGRPMDIEAADRAIEKERSQVVGAMKKGLTSLATIAATAPFVGLLGTVIGIIGAFTGMATTGSGGIGAVSKGIAEALFTTAFGLFVAIPAVWIFNYFNGRVEQLQIDIDTIKADVLDRLLRTSKAHAG